MITEANRKVEDQTESDRIRKDCQEIINTSAIYERLEVNPDWQKHMDILRNMIRIHKSQIDGWMAQMGGASLFKRIKMMDVMVVHQVRKEQAEEWINYPGRILEQSKQAKEILAELRKKETRTNGKPS